MRLPHRSERRRRAPRRELQMPPADQL